MGNFIKKAKLKLDHSRPGAVFGLTALLIISLSFVVLTFFLLARHAQHEQEWMSLATEVQVTSQQMAKFAGAAAAGNLDAFLELGTSRLKIQAAMNTLLGGSIFIDLPATPAGVEAPMQQLSLTWHRMGKNALGILNHKALIVELTSAHNIVQATIPGIQKHTDAVMRSLTQSGAPTIQVVFASRQLVLADRILRRASEVLQGGNNATMAATRLRNDLDLFAQVLTALSRGNKSLGVAQVSNAQALRSQGQIRDLFATIRPKIEAILASADDLFEVRGAADEIFLDSQDVFDEASNLKKSITELPQTRVWPSQMTGSAGLALVVFIAWIMLYTFLSAERRQAKIAAKDNRKNQQAILKLLDEMSSLADGDLTVQASVTDDITGAIADAVNFAIEQLRELVKGIKYTAQQVAGSAMDTRAFTSELAKAAALQAEKVGAATKTAEQMAQSFDTMAKRSAESSDAAHRSVEIAHNGGEKVRETITGMDTIRGQIQQTSKRIKRLGESTQQIGDIVEMINGIAEQTNVLALNAAIQAASAGGAGKGFVVVADEVQQLAESATNATRRIETLVQTIQADTAEAVISMESTTSEVVSGARLAQDAGTALEQIEAGSKDLSNLIAGISAEAQTQSEAATEISGLMKRVQAIAVQSSEGSTKAATSVDELAELVMHLSNSVTDFKLPEDE